MLTNIHFSNLLKKDYWLEIDRVSLHFIDKSFLYLGAVLVVLGVGVLVWKSIYKNQLLKPSLSTIGNTLLVVGILEMLWFLLRIQFISVLGTRISALIVVIAGILWLIKPIKYLLLHYKSDLQDYHKKQLKEKYLQMR